jgi:NAD(P)-dependent dehydrogenase (short-subunit alcohol dehydrogenase family)
VNIIIISASSDIGFNLALKWSGQGSKIIGTYRTPSDNVRELKKHKVNVFKCDLNRYESIINFVSKINDWDVLLFCPGTMEPIGPFGFVPFSHWKRSVETNFISQMQVLHNLLSKRNRKFSNGPVVIFFAGGGTNNAPVNYSAYTISKIALIKMVELLDAEISDTRFSIIGPGWVDTKIHRETLKAGVKAGDNYQKTIQKFNNKDGITSMESIIECCNWIIDSPRDVVSGRNFSVVYDKWGEKGLDAKLKADKHMYKLRRHKN